jgi:hypothetical protein
MLLEKDTFGKDCNKNLGKKEKKNVEKKKLGNKSPGDKRAG